MNNAKAKNILIFISFFFVFIFSVIVVFKPFFYTKKEINLMVYNGDGVNKIGNKLYQLDVVSSLFLFKLQYRFYLLFNNCNNVEVGEYKIENNINCNEIFDKICNGKVEMKSITFPEGLETREMLSLINQNDYLVGEHIDNYEEEGALLPETYFFKSGTEKLSLLYKMEQDLNTFLDKEWNERDYDILDEVIENKKDAVILASIVEKEAKNDEERPIIASVYLNRLKKNMRLEADPTTIYEITKGKYKLNRLLNRKDLSINGNYNTYRKKGLPIAPICNAGKKSILAVLHPARTNYLYFVAKENLSGHYFSETYKEHLQNIKKIKENKRKING